MLILILIPKITGTRKGVRKFWQKIRTPVVEIGKKEATYLPQKMGCGKESWQKNLQVLLVFFQHLYFLCYELKSTGIFEVYLWFLYEVFLEEGN